MAQALDDFRRLVSYSNLNASALTWNEPLDMVLNGDAAMTIMGDWGKGYANVQAQGRRDVRRGPDARHGRHLRVHHRHVRADGGRPERPGHVEPAEAVRLARRAGHLQPDQGIDLGAERFGHHERPVRRDGEADLLRLHALRRRCPPRRSSRRRATWTRSARRSPSSRRRARTATRASCSTRWTTTPTCCSRAAGRRPPPTVTDRFCTDGPLVHRRGGFAREASPSASRSDGFARPRRLISGYPV